MLRFGFLAAGSADIDQNNSYECSGESCGFTIPSDSDSASFDDDSAIMFGADLLFHVSPVLRIGPGLIFVPTTKIGEDGVSAKLGSELAPTVVVEGVFPASPTLYIPVRLQGGPLILFPGGELEDSLDRMGDCGPTVLPPIPGSVPPTCSADVNDGPFVGYTIAGGPGVLFPLDAVRLRADILIQYLSVGIIDSTRRTTMTTTTGTTTTTRRDEETLSSLRFWIVGGLEF